MLKKGLENIVFKSFLYIADCIAARTLPAQKRELQVCCLAFSFFTEGAYSSVSV